MSLFKFKSFTLPSLPGNRKVTRGQSPTQSLIPFSDKYPNEFLSRGEDNFNILLDKLSIFYNKTRADIGDGTVSRRKIDGRFNYDEELQDVQINQNGITTDEVASELNDILQGCIRHQNPTTAFNLMPAPLLDTVAGVTLMSLYNPNTCWDFISGKLCLYEKKIVRMLGQLANWSHADGFVVTGGKQALMYAIKNGMARSSSKSDMEIHGKIIRILTTLAERPHPDMFTAVDGKQALMYAIRKGMSGSKREVKISDQVVIYSQLAHYSIEHVCHFLGINQNNCFRVATLPSGEVDLQALEKTMNQVISQGKRIAAVIAVGGATINLIPDQVLEVKKTINRIAATHYLDYTPYLHVDTVISWAWLAFANAEDNSWKNNASPRVTEKVEHILSKLSGIHYADSFAADFHKIGFCPYAAGVFIARESNHLSGMAQDGSIPAKDIRFGEAEVYRQTIENSRPGLTIASVWIALRRMGLEGLRQFVLYQLEVCEMFKRRIQESYSEHFEVINEHTNGWEIVLKPHFHSPLSWDRLQNASEEEQAAYSKTCHQFLSDLWYGSMDEQQHRAPVIGFVKKYSRKGSHEQGFPSFLIHPCSLHYTKETIDEMLEGIVQAKIAFEKQCSSSIHSDDSYLSQFIPPR